MEQREAIHRVAKGKNEIFIPNAIYILRSNGRASFKVRDI